MKQFLFAAMIRVIPLLLLCVLSSSLCVAAPKVREGGGAQRYVTIDFNDVDINLFIKYISELTHKNFIVDRDVKGKVTIISPSRISEEEAYRVFESVLEVHGYTAVPSGSVVKIVPSVQARSKNIDLMEDDTVTGPEDRVVTRLVPLKHASPDQVKTMLTPLVSKTSIMVADTQSNMLIITDVQSNILRLMDIIRAIDIPSNGERLAIIPLKFASAETVAKSIGQLFVVPNQKGARAETIKIIPFERNNTLIVYASQASIDRIRELMAQLDVEMPTGEGNIRVVYLQHANAEELVKVLMNLPEDSSSSSSSTTNSKKKSAVPTAPAISKDVKIVADEETNALVITGPREEYQVIEQVIKKLDIPRRMVYLEALIMEVKVNKDFKVGVEWGGSGTYADETGTVFGGFSGSSSDAYSTLSAGSSGDITSVSGFTFGVLKQGVDIGGVYFPNLGAVVNAYKNDEGINIIATPQILTTDNKEATIKVGENVPYITSKNTTDADEDYTNYEYKDLTTTMKITPQINQADVVRMEIGVEVIKLKDLNDYNPTTYTRTADTTVVVHDRETVVIGGMIGQDTTNQEYKVPILGDIPLLGWLFKSHTNEEDKTNLYIFITPRIVENPAELAEIYQKKRDDIEKVHKEAGDIADRYFHPVDDPAYSVSLADIGLSKLRKDDLQGAEEYLRQALKINPENGSAMMNMGVLYERRGKRAEAESMYLKVLSLKPKDKAQEAELKTLKEMATQSLEILRNGAAQKK